MPVKLSEIKTREEFFAFADVWYQRTHKLREVWQNEETPTERGLKALRLWEEMKNRVLKLAEIAKVIDQPKYPR